MCEHRTSFVFIAIPACLCEHKGSPVLASQWSCACGRGQGLLCAQPQMHGHCDGFVWRTTYSSSKTLSGERTCLGTWDYLFSSVLPSLFAMYFYKWYLILKTGLKWAIVMDPREKSCKVRCNFFFNCFNHKLMYRSIRIYSVFFYLLLSSFNFL